MTDPTIPTALPPLPGCGRPATARFELYDNAAYRSLDGSIYLCDQHADAYALRKDTGLTPYRTAGLPVPGKRCGDGYDYRVQRALDAPEVTTEPDDDNPAAEEPAFTGAETIHPQPATGADWSTPAVDDVLRRIRALSPTEAGRVLQLWAREPASASVAKQEDQPGGDGSPAERRIVFDGRADGTVEWRCSCGSSGSGSSPAAAERIADAHARTPQAEHVTRTRQLPGGPIEVRCSCGKWGGVAPSYAAAEKSAAKHRASSR